MRRAWAPGLSCAGFFAFAGSQATSPGLRECFPAEESSLRSVMAMRSERAGVGVAVAGDDERADDAVDF